MTHRFYSDLAPWWPLLSAPEEYLEEATEALRLLSTADRPVREVLELGSGGGNIASHLAAYFELTLVDISPEMLAVSRRLNHLSAHHVGDMRSVRLDRSFDAVLIHDAIDYMLTEEDLRAAMATAFAHCRPGGTVVLMPDHTTESWMPETDHGGHDGPDGRAARYLSWDRDADPNHNEVSTDYVFLLRAGDGEPQVVHETHRSGLFPTASWLRLLTEAGFVARVELEHTTEDRAPRTMFVGRRPQRLDGSVD